MKLVKLGLLAMVSAMALLGGCATTATPPTAPPVQLFQDQLFKPSAETIDAEQVFALSPAMSRYLDKEIAAQLRTKGSRQGLIDALYTKGELLLEYDSEMTRNAAQAFAARSGNCLSLVIMTAAFAKQLNLPVRYQSVYVDETWSRSGDLYFVSGHVNLTLGRPLHEMRTTYGIPDTQTIDFLPPSQLRGQRAQPIEERTIVAMYMNNRAAESLYQGGLDQAYWWARAAIAQDPKLTAAYNTLGVVYRRHGNSMQAEVALRHVLAREPGNTQALSNLLVVLNDQGRQEEAKPLAALLHQLQPYPPYKFFDLGVLAMRSGDYQTARDMFNKEIERSAYYHEFHFWLALAHYGLGDVSAARKQMALALENSTTTKDRNVYSAKLESLKAYRSLSR